MISTGSKIYSMSSMDFQDFIDLHSENDSNEILGEE